jgi:hypothetical protein
MENYLIYRATFSIEGRPVAFFKKNGEWYLASEKTN